MKTQTAGLVLSLMVAALAAGPALAAGDPEAGERVFQRCAVCHAVEADAPQKLGPNLHGLFGREAGTVEDFQNYSSAMKKLDVVWTEEVLMKYLAMPQQMVPGTTMAFAGLPSEEDRRDLIAYLKEATQ